MKQHADGVWTASSPTKFLGMAFGCRMTVLATDVGLVLHSPIPLDDARVAELAELGEVCAIFCPNAFHHLHAEDAKARYPKASLIGPRALVKKRKDLAFDIELAPGERPDLPWDTTVLDAIFMAGQKTMEEWVLLHRPSGTLVTTDLVLNVDGDDWWTRFYMSVSGFKGKPVHSRLLKWVTWSDKTAAQTSIRAILDEEWDRLVLSHGELVESGGKDALREAFTWLL